VFRQKLSAVVNLSAAVALLTLAFRGSALAQTVFAPELDPQSIGAGLAICGGLAALFLERYRRRTR
jgi:hypothetical protein